MLFGEIPVRLGVEMFCVGRLLALYETIRLCSGSLD